MGLQNADILSIKRSISSVNWKRTIRHTNPNNGVPYCIENICSNFCPHEVTCRHKDTPPPPPPWMSSETKTKNERGIRYFVKMIRNFEMKN